MGKQIILPHRHINKPRIPIILQSEIFSNELAKELHALDSEFYTTEFDENWYINRLSGKSIIFYTLRTATDNSPTELIGYIYIVSVTEAYLNTLVTNFHEGFRDYHNTNLHPLLYIPSLMIKEDYRSLHLGLTLLTLAKTYLRTANKPCYLVTENKLITFYNSMGFEVVTNLVNSKCPNVLMCLTPQNIDLNLKWVPKQNNC